MENGIELSEVPVGRTIRMQTRSRLYIIRKTGEDEYTMEGHREYCPIPTVAKIRDRAIEIGVRLAFSTAIFPDVLYSSPVKAIEVI